MLKNLQNRNKGFTIVEVMIVLAIAGLIILIVFLAVPALQRSSRNTQARNAAAAVLAVVNEYTANNGGTFPTAVAIAADGTINVTGAGTAAAGKTQSGYTANATGTMPAAQGAYSVALNRKCNATGTDLAAGAAPRAVSVLYRVETGTATATQCTES